MSIVEYETITNNRGPSKKAVNRYKEAIYATAERGELPDDSEIFAAYRTVEVAKLDCTTYRRRLAEKHAFQVEYPRLSAEAAAAEKIAQSTLPWDARPTDGLTVGQLKALLASSQSGWPPPEIVVAKNARATAEECKRNAINFLRETADPEISLQLSELEQQRASIRGGMLARQEVLDIDAAIIRQRARCDAIARGEPLVDIVGPIHPDREAVNKNERARLDRLMDKRATKPQAEQDQAADAKRLDEIGDRMQTLEASRFDPRNMAWA